MFLILYALWFVFNGRITLEIALFGLPICALIYLFCCKFLGYSPHKDWKAIKKLGKILSYIWFMLGEIVKANLNVIRLILSPQTLVEPQLVTFKTPLKSDNARTVLADSITITPGTITVEMKEDELTVHCLDRELGQGIEDSESQKRLLKLEEE